MTVPGGKDIGSISLSVLLFASLFVIAGTASAQVDTSTTVSTSDEVTAASGSNRFVVWWDSTPGNEDIFFRRSTDNGATWQPTVNLSNNPGSSLYPQIAVSGSDVYIVWLQLNSDEELPNLFFRRSTDNGATWEARVKLSSSGTVLSTSVDVAHLVASGSNVYVVWQEDGDVVSFRRSTDNGASWKSIIVLSTHGNDHADPRLAVSGSNVYAVWSSSGDDAIFSRSTNNGATWGADINLSGASPAAMCPRVAASGSHIYVVWEQSFDGDTCLSSPDDIIFRRSTDNGETWKSKVNLSNTPEGSGYQQIVASGSNVYVAWSDDLDETVDVGSGEIFFRRSTDNGATWKAIINLSNNPGLSKAPQVAMSGSNVYVAWVQFNFEGELPNVFFKRSTDSGATWKTKINLSNTGSASVPDLAASGSSVYVAWPEQNVGNGDILFRRSTDNGATWKAVKDLSENEGTSWNPQIGV